MDGEVAQNLQQPANAEAVREATAFLQVLRLQDSTNCDAGADVPLTSDVTTGAELDVSLSKVVTEDSCLSNNQVDPSMVWTVEEEAEAEAQFPDGASNKEAVVTEHIPSGKPLVEAPEFGDRVRDTDKEPYWIPGAFPTIFQNQTGDLHNYVLKEPDMATWGPHIMRARGWHAQAHMTFSYWWLNMVQRTQVLSAKKWYVRDNPKATGYTVDDIRGMGVHALARNMVGYTANIPGTRASKSQLRKIILTMVKQIEIETAVALGCYS